MKLFILAFLALGLLVNCGGSKDETPVYTIVSMEQGDLMCYVSLKDKNNQDVAMNATFEICEKQADYVNKKVKIAAMEKVSVADCESSEPCGKSKMEDVIKALQIVE